MKYLSIFLIAALFLSSGCSSRLKHGSEEVGFLSLFKKDTTIIDGQTTKSDILERFGKDFFTSFDNQGREQWIYRYTKGLIGKGSRSHKYLILTYTEDSLVKHHEILKTWIGGGSFCIEEVLFRSVQQQNPAL